MDFLCEGVGRQDGCRESGSITPLTSEISLRTTLKVVCKRYSTYLKRVRHNFRIG